jgi:hypothetical protein
MKNIRQGVLVFGLLCSSVVGSASADGNTGLIYGKVLLAGSHQPVCPIAVIVRSDRQAPLETFTAGDGSYHFLSVSPGPVTLSIGRSRSVQSLSVSANLLTFVEPTYLPAIRPLSLRPSRRAQLARRICPENSYQGYVFSDFDE